MIPTTLATRSRKESKLKAISRVRRRRRIMACSGASGQEKPAGAILPAAPSPGASSAASRFQGWDKPGDKFAGRPHPRRNATADGTPARQDEKRPGGGRSLSEPLAQ